jgi:hypothetical protein
LAFNEFLKNTHYLNNEKNEAFKFKKKKIKNKLARLSCSTYNFATLDDKYHIYGKKINESNTLRSMIINL